MGQEGEGAGFGGSLWSVCVHNIHWLASPGRANHRQSALETLSVGHTCGQNVATYLWAKPAWTLATVGRLHSSGL